MVGAGLVGLTAALKLAQVCKAKNQQIALIAPVAKKVDFRTTAMMMPSIEFLKSMGQWETIEAHSAALKIMRLIDGSQRLIRSPLTDFKASEMGLEAFGYNVPNEKMIEQFQKSIANTQNIVQFNCSLEKATCFSDRVELELSNGTKISAILAVAADGRHSNLRHAAGIQTREWSYTQTALALSFSHTIPHDGVSSEFHTETGPFTQVPLPPSKKSQHRSSLVWAVHPNEVDELLCLTLDEISKIVETKLHSSLGKVEIEHQPQAFPLSGMTAKRFASNRVALVGETAHVFPPIGAQGFNLGLRDVLTIAEEIENSNDDYGSQDLLEAYSRKRSFDISSRTKSIDIMNRSLLTDFLPVQAARALGIGTLGKFSWLRKIAMKQGMGVP